MKANLCFPRAAMILLSLFYVQSLTAQNVAPYWSLSGNTNATTVSKIGTVNSVPLRFVTKNFDRIRIDTFGRVGIGTTTPFQLLHVNGNSTITGNLGIGISTAAQKLHVVGNAAFTGSVGIGLTGPSYKLHVVTTGTAIHGNSTAGGYGVWGNSTYLGVYGTGTTYGLYGVASDATGYGVRGYGGGYGVYGTSTNSAYGVYGTSSSTYSANGSTGVYGTAYYGVHGVGTYGVWGEGTYGIYGSSTSGYGVYGASGFLGTYGSGTSYGVYGYSSSGYGSSGFSSTNYGVYGESGSGNGGRFYSASGYGLWASTGRADNNWAGVFDGNVYCYNVYQTSDKRLKKNIVEFTDAMGIINQLKPKSYEFNTDGRLSSLNLPLGQHYGLIAQDVETVLPNLVKESVHDLNFAKTRPNAITLSADGKEPAAAIQKESEQKIAKDDITIKAVNYTELIPVMIKAMQELSKQNEDLQQQVNDLKQTVNKLQHGSILNAPESGSLAQSQPNPVNGMARIQYSLPKNFNNAQLVITDNRGTVIKTVQLNVSGKTDIDVSAFTNGVYNYSLVVNNKIVQTKQMTVLR